MTTLANPDTRLPLHIKPPSLNTILQYVVLLVLLVLSLFVLVMMVNMSLRPQIMILTNFWGIAVPPTLANYDNAIGQLLSPMMRTLFICGAAIAGIVAIACPASYALARVRFPGRQVIYFGVLITLLMAGILLLTPRFVLATQLNLRGSLWGLLLTYIADGQAFAIFLITTFFLSQSEEIFEAARIDGATELQAMLRVAIPMAWPIITTVAILNFIGIYSDLIWLSLMVSQNDGTLIMALQRFNTQNSMLTSRPDWGVRAAGYALSTVPQLVLFAVAMKQFVQGLTSGALKG